MYCVVQNTSRKRLLELVLCIKCFKINFFPKIRFINFKIVFLKMQFFTAYFKIPLLSHFLTFWSTFKKKKSSSNTRLQYT